MLGITVPKRDEKLQKQYETLIDTFKAFDANGSGELSFEEFENAWKCIGKKGDSATIRS